MKDTGKILSIVLIIISIFLLYFVFKGNSKLNEAVKIINEVSDKVKDVKDSLQNAQNTIQGVLKKLEFTENELKILKAERDLLALEEQKKYAKNMEEVRMFKSEIKKIENKKDSLIHEAKKFEL